MSKHKIIVFGLLYHQHILNFSAALKKFLGYTMIGINNNPNYRFEKEEEAKSIYTKIYNAKRCKISFLDNILKTLSSVIYFLFIDKKVDFVLFHFLSKFVYPLAKISKWRGMKTCVFVFGSDFKRANEPYLIYIGKVFRIIDYIVCDSTEMLEELKDAFPVYASKMKCCFFGSPIVDELLCDSSTPEIAKNKLQLCNKERRIVMCGYNGCKEQHHLKIIDSLKEFSGNIHFVFPMTYSCNESYRLEVKEYCEQLNLSYTILEHFLENEEWKNYLFATDIFVHMQLTDAFSACVSENLLLGNVVINSEWVNYPDLERAGAYFLTANFDNLKTVFGEVLSNYNFYHERSQSNRYIIERFKGLEYTVKNEWGPYFNSICK